MKKGAILAFTLLAASFSASATTISFNATISSTLTNWDSYGVAPQQVGQLTVQKFDTTLGTLNSVSFSLTGAFTGAVNLSNGAGTATWTQLKQDTLINVYNNPIDGNVVLIVADPTATLINNTKSAPAVVLGPGGTKTFSSSATQTVGVGPLSDSATKLAYSTAGVGYVSLDVDATRTELSAVSGGAPSTGGSANAEASFTVTYDYTAAPPPPTVPEPATMALTGGVLLGLGLLARRKK